MDRYTSDESLYRLLCSVCYLCLLFISLLYESGDFSDLPTSKIYPTGRFPRGSFIISPTLDLLFFYERIRPPIVLSFVTFVSPSDGIGKVPGCHLYSNLTSSNLVSLRGTRQPWTPFVSYLLPTFLSTKGVRPYTSVHS